MEQKYIVAFEIGSSGVKGAIGTINPTTPTPHVDILAVETEPLIDKIRYGCVENPGDVATCVNNIISRLQQATPGHIIRQAYVGVSGRSLIAMQRDVQREFHAEIEITRTIIDQLMEKASTRPLPDREVVAVTPGSFYIDSQLHLDPLGMFGHTLAATVNLIICKPKIRNNIRRVFNERCNLNIAGYIVTPLALSRQLLTVEERRLGVMLVDLGAETTTVSIYRDGALQYLVTIPMGSRNITRDITTLNCLEERAEEIKKAVGNAMPPTATPGTAPLVTDGLDNTDINRIVSARADEIISNIFEQITYASLRPDQLPAGIVITGRGSHLRGFNDLLAQQTHMKVRPATLLGPVSITGSGINPADTLDVISLLTQAALDPDPADCTIPDPAITGDITPRLDTTPGTPRDNNDDTPRINTYAQEEDDPTLLIDDPEPDDNDNPGTNNKKQTRHRDKPHRDSRSTGWWNGLSKRIGEMLSDNEEFDN